MLNPQYPPSEFQAGAVALLIVGALCLWRTMRWIRTGPLRPDPWDSATEASVQSAEAVPVCRHCFAPQMEHVHFCSECGTSVGDYNNLLPYVNLFSVGESMRTGSSGKYRITPVTTVGYFLWSMTEYSVFAPVYWFFLIRNVRRISNEQLKAVEELKNEGSL
ncbi:MAG: hypothetical protein JWM68_2447 [Verrucomicrobiales bacterium]|nr:hypothetical protein [Verrucomicrobiales bacterium]